MFLVVALELFMFAVTHVRASHPTPCGHISSPLPFTTKILYAHLITAESSVTNKPLLAR
jgi:hypothetical protein